MISKLNFKKYFLIIFLGYFLFLPYNSFAITVQDLEEKIDLYLRRIDGLKREISDFKNLLKQINICKRLVGDVNGDGFINCADLKELEEMRMNKKTPNAASDIDNDGRRATTFDIDKLRQILNNNNYKCESTPSGQRGDVNDDGVVDCKDYYLLQQMYLNATTANDKADVDGDKAVAKLSDLQALLKILSSKGYICISMPGDVNGDGIVDCKDMDELLQMSLGHKPVNNAADVNQDGSKADIGDLNTLTKILLGKNMQCSSMKKGDVNGDNKVNCDDVNTLVEMALGNIAPNAASDIDGDGQKATINDVISLVNILSKDGVMCTSKLTKGDVNQDGKIDCKDASDITDMVLGLKQTNSAADINGNGQVTVDDAVQLVNILNKNKIICSSGTLKGDVNKDGKIDCADLSELNSMALGLKQSNDAADINNDKSVDISDLLNLTNILRKMGMICQL